MPVWIIAALLALIAILLAERQMMQTKLESACGSWNSFDEAYYSTSSHNYGKIHFNLHDDSMYRR